MRNQIAMIGNASAGKTVLLTVLAHRLSHGEFRGVRLVPVNTDSNPRGAEQTMTYINSNWDILNTGKPWSTIRSTEQGHLVECSFNFVVHGVKEPFPFHDMAGQDLTLFPFRRLDTNDYARLNEMEKRRYDKEFKIVDYVQQSSVILVLINLRLFLNEPEREIRLRNETQLLSALNGVFEDKDDVFKLGQRPCVAFVLPQWDQYEYTVKNEYAGSCYKFLKQELPLIYQEHIAGKLSVKVFPVAAVADTIDDDRDNDGIDENYPLPDFKSTGLAPLVRWIGRCTVPITVRVCWWLFAVIALVLSSVIGCRVGPYLCWGIGLIIQYFWNVAANQALFNFNEGKWLEFPEAYWDLWKYLGWAVGLLCSIFATIVSAELGKRFGRAIATKVNRPLYNLCAWCYEKVSWLWC